MGNKLDIADANSHHVANDGQSETHSTTAATDEASLIDGPLPPPTPSSVSTKRSYFGDAPASNANGSIRNGSSNNASGNGGLGFGAVTTATKAPEGREVRADTASTWAASRDIPVAVEVSALSGENVDEVFSRLARMILAKIELGEIDPDDPQSGIQYGDSGTWDGFDGGSVKSGLEGEGARRRRGRGGGGGLRRRTGTWVREWEEVFRLDVPRRRGGCC